MVHETVNEILGKAFNIRISRCSGVPLKERVLPLTTPTVARLLYFYEHLRSIQSLDGSIVECGVGWGRSLLHLALCQTALDKQRMIYGFDSFEGFPEPTAEDEPEHTDVTRGRYKTRQESVVNFLINSGVRERFIRTHIRLVSGFFADSLRRYDGGPVSLLHLDCDLYASYLETLEYFYPMLVNGGVIAFDEYESQTYPGARKAIDEFFEGRGDRIVKSAIVDRYYAVKS